MCVANQNMKKANPGWLTRTNGILSNERAATILIVAGTPLFSLAETKPEHVPLLPTPATLIGEWFGEARHGDETAEIAMVFEKEENGRALTREWLPNLNAYAR